MPDDTEGQPVYPVVVDPFENEYFCSGIADQPDGAVQMSTWFVIRVFPRLRP